jgi:hypothetical protein
MKDTLSSNYASIEQFEYEDPHPSFDIWSVGIIGYKLMTKKEPYT